MRVVTVEGFKRWLCHAVSLVVVILLARILLFAGGRPQGPFWVKASVYMLLLSIGMGFGEAVWQRFIKR